MFAVRAAKDFRWLCERTESNLTWKARGIECVDERDGKIVGQVAYDNPTPNACTGHIALAFPAVWRRLLYPTFEYPFLEADKGVLVIAVASDNARSLRLVRRCGFRVLCVVRDYVRVGIDMVQFEMRREECRFLRRTA
jgi:RimJ/RimL family protein N-acetyltransferase